MAQGLQSKVYIRIIFNIFLTAANALNIPLPSLPTTLTEELILESTAAQRQAEAEAAAAAAAVAAATSAAAAAAAAIVCPGDTMNDGSGNCVCPGDTVNDGSDKCNCADANKYPDANGNCVTCAAPNSDFHSTTGIVEGTCYLYVQ